MAFDLYHDAIINEVVEKAKLMSHPLVPEVVEALKKEGVKLPEPNNNVSK